MLGQLSLGKPFQALLDASSQGGKGFGLHRELDHTWERLQEVQRLYGDIGYMEFLLHLLADYDLLPSLREQGHKEEV